MHNGWFGGSYTELNWTEQNENDIWWFYSRCTKQNRNVTRNKLKCTFLSAYLYSFPLKWFLFNIAGFIIWTLFFIPWHQPRIRRQGKPSFVRCRIVWCSDAKNESARVMSCLATARHNCLLRISFIFLWNGDGMADGRGGEDGKNLWIFYTSRQF